MTDRPSEGDMSQQVLAELIALKDFMGERFDRVDDRLDRVEVRLGRMEVRFTSVEGRVAGLEREFTAFRTERGKRRGSQG